MRVKRRTMPKAIDAERQYDIIRKPVITEKSTQGAENNQVTFEVAMDATKPEIKLAVEALFSVKVESVNTLIRKGKAKRFRGRKGVRSDVKHAVLRLADGESIDLASGL